MTSTSRLPNNGLVGGVEGAGEASLVSGGTAKGASRSVQNMERVTCTCHEWIHPRILAACRRARIADRCAFCLVEYFLKRRVEMERPVKMWFEEAA